MRALKIYLALVGASIRSQLRYRSSLAFNTLGYFVTFWSEFLGIWILFSHFGNLAGWSMEEVLVCYGLAHLSFAFSEFLTRGFEFVALLARDGEYDRYLLRPVDTTVLLAGYEFALHRLGRVLQSSIVLAYGLARLGDRATLPGLALLAWALVGGTALFSGAFVLQGCAGMKALQNIEAFNILTNGGPDMAQFPMSIYPRPLRLAFTFLVPLAGAVYYPALSYLRRPEALPLALGWASPLGGVAFLALSLLAFKAVERSYVSAGS